MRSEPGKRRNALVSWSVFLFVIFSCEATPAYRYAALDDNPIDDSRNDHSAGASRKLGRGLANTGLGWTEIFKGIEDVQGESGFWAGATWGPLYGAVNAVKRTGIGLYETATFPFAGPNRFDPVLEPEFPMSSDN